MIRLSEKVILDIIASHMQYLIWESIHQFIKKKVISLAMCVCVHIYYIYSRKSYI